MATIKCDVCNEPDQLVGKPCAFCEEIVMAVESDTEPDYYADYHFDETAIIPFSELTPTDGYAPGGQAEFYEKPRGIHEVGEGRNG